MDLSRHFPATAWMWRRVTSRWARRIWAALALTLLVTTAVLRIHSAVFQHRVTTILTGMAQLRLDQTGKAEMLARVPDLRPGLPDGSACYPDECYSVEFRNWPDRAIYRFVALGGHPAFRAGAWLGLHFWQFSAEVRLRQGKVRDVSYFLMVDNFTYTYPGMVRIGVHSERSYEHEYPTAMEDESPDYRVTHYFKWPDLHTRVAFTPEASPRLVRHAFDVQLDCLWSLRGCRTVTQILPAAESDRQAIEQAARMRLHSSDPCPDRILPRRARDLPDILLAEVKSVGPEVNEKCYGRYRVVDFELREVLKGKVRQPLEGAPYPLDTYDLGPGQPAPNPDARLLRPGTRVLLFPDLDEPCRMVAATDSALRTIRAALASGAARAADEDRAPQ